jgi:uncharacterized membrane protein YdjX (TVP38/TMEM64 family)
MRPAHRPLAQLHRAGRAAIVVALIGAAVLVWRHRGALDPGWISGAIAAQPAAPLVFLALHIVASLIFFPRTVLAVAAGLVFGIGWGLVWASAGSVLGAIAGFLVARYVNSGVIEPESLPRLGPMLLRAEAGGWRSVAALRLIPVVPHSLANYALGLTRLRLGSYVLGSFLGQLPMTLAYVELGAAGGRLWTGAAGWLAPTLVGVAALAVSLLLPRWARSRG